MAFSVVVEMLNLRMRRSRQPVQLRKKPAVGAAIAKGTPEDPSA